MKDRQKILVVDDEPVNIKILMDILKDDYSVVAATSGEKALKLAKAEQAPDIVLLDIMMPGTDGFEVCEILKREERTKFIPIIFITAMNQIVDEERGLKLGAVDYISKPINPSLVKKRVDNQLELKAHRDNLEEQVRIRTKEVSLTQEITIQSMATLAEYRDPETGGHIKRTQNYVRALADYIHKNHLYDEIDNYETTHLLYLSAPLHDIGKVGIPDNILLKPGKLTDDEFDIMKKHALYGFKTIESSLNRLGKDSFLRYAAEIALTHHEKWNGSGYPNKMKGESIPLSGRLMAIADVYDALISKRVYKPPFHHSKAKRIIEEGSGTHFDPKLVEVFLNIEEQFKQIAIEFSDHEEERQILLSEE